MGRIYKEKKRSCGLCKPYKVGYSDKKKYKERFWFKEQPDN